MHQINSRWGGNPPSALQIEITSHCNLHCKMCPLTTESTHSSLKAGHFSEVLWDDLVPLAREVGQVLISGYGEPLTNPKCLPLLKQLDAEGISMGMITNGTALSPRICTELAQLSHLTHICVSIDSPDPVIYREIRGGDVQNAFRGVKNLLGCIDHPARVSVSSVMMRSTMASLVEFPRLLAGFGVRRYILQGMVDLNATFPEEAFMERESLASQVDKIRQDCRENGIELCFTLPQRLDLELHDPESVDRLFYRSDLATEKAARQCFLPWEIPYIDKDGGVFPCCIAAAKGTANFGTLSDEGLLAIWNGANYRRFREDILDGRTTPVVCQDCKVAPLGEHPLRLYGARILSDESRLEGVSPLKLVVENIGTITWNRDDMIRIGTSNPRDHAAACAHPTWLSKERVVSFMESTVPPGSKATFLFQVNPLAEGEREFFQLVVEGKCWLPYTHFSIGSESPARPPAPAMVGK
jgi:MoaA/NifB/PqqE/SkfB family radical SAM enzyme